MFLALVPLRMFNFSLCPSEPKERTPETYTVSSYTGWCLLEKSPVITADLNSLKHTHTYWIDTDKIINPFKTVFFCVEADRLDVMYHLSMSAFLSRIAAAKQQHLSSRCVFQTCLLLKDCAETQCEWGGRKTKDVFSKRKKKIVEQ